MMPSTEPRRELRRIPLLETVWKILEGFSTVRVWWQKRPVETPLCPLGASPISISGPISIFQTVSLRGWVNKRRGGRQRNILITSTSRTKISANGAPTTNRDHERKIRV